MATIEINGRTMTAEEALIYYIGKYEGEDKAAYVRDMFLQQEIQRQATGTFWAKVLAVLLSGYLAIKFAWHFLF
jgi:hypothetical protein